MTRASVREYATRQRERYQQATRTQKRELVDEMVAVTRMHRKAAIRRLRAAPRLRLSRAGRPRRYGPEVSAAGETLWQASGRVGAHRLHLRCDELRLAPAVD